MDSFYDSKLYSIVALLGIIALAVSQRRVIFSVSVTGIFCTSYLAFVILGILAYPWILKQVYTWFVAVGPRRIGDDDVARAIVLMVVGLGLVVLFAQLSHYAFTKGKFIRSRPHLLIRSASPTLNLPLRRLVIISGVCMVFALAYVAMNLSVFVSGFRDGLLGGRYLLLLEARRAATSNYIWVLLVYNVIPFYAAMLWAASRVKTNRLFRAYALFFNIGAAVLLVLVFQKRPVLVFLIVIAMVSLFVVHRTSFSEAVQRRRRKRALLYGMALLVFLAVLFSSYVKFEADASMSYKAQFLLGLVSLRLLGRLSLAVPMYVHCYPDVYPHFGVSNVGILAKICGKEAFRDTRHVFRYFTGNPEGSIAIPALGSFYGAFGFFGWFVGCAVLGVLLDRLDAWLMSQKKNIRNQVFIIFMLIFAYYLSQASLNASMLGYGGGLFVLMWMSLKPAKRSRALTQVEQTRPQDGRVWSTAT